MAETEIILSALFDWLKSVCPQDVQTIDDISNATVLWKVLQEIDNEGFRGDLPSQDDTRSSHESEIDRLNDLRHLYKALTVYVVLQCRRKLPLPSGEPDVEAIAKTTSEKDLAQLLKLVFLAAIFGRFSMEYIEQLTSFGSLVQAQFYLILEEPEALEEPTDILRQFESRLEKDKGGATSPENAHQPDREFIYEERIARLVSFNKQLEHETTDLKEQLENMHDLHTKLQQSYDNLEVQHQDTVERLDALRSGKGEQSMLGIQRTKMQQQENVIATLEAQVNSLQEENNRLKVQQDLLKSQTEGFQQMQDDLYELKLEREQLQRKANAADKYKQKLQSLQKVEDENEALKYRVTEMQRQLKQSDSEEFTTSGLQRENDEFRRLVSNIEQELSNSNAAKKRVEFENMALAAKLQNADEQATRWRKRAEKLQDRLSEYQHPESPSTPRATTSNGLNLAKSEDGSESDTELNKGISEMQVEDQNMITEQELQTILSIMKAHTQLSSNEEKTSSVQEQQRLAAKIERSRAITRELAQHTDTQAGIITTLKALLASAANSSPTPSTAPDLPLSKLVQPDINAESDRRLEEALTQIANLERELQLMASAWYEQNARLISNAGGISMARGKPPPEPRSFLGRQRRLVDSVLTGRS